MKFLFLSLFYFCSELFGIFQTNDVLTIAQNKPIVTGVSVTFKIQGSTGAVPNVAWDFGDGTNLGGYTKSLTATHRYTTAGVYQVFARVEGEEIPISVVQTIIKPMSNPRPTHSSTIVMDTTTKRVWVVNSDNNSVSIIDAVTSKMITEISVGKHPRNLALDKNGNVWVTNEDDATISIINRAGQVVKTIKLPFASRPYGICFDPLLNSAFVSLQATGKLLKYNGVTQVLSGEIEVGRSPRAIAISSNGSRIFVTQFISPADRGLVREINPQNMTLRTQHVLAYDPTPDFEDRGRGVPNCISSITITPDNTEAWTTSKKDNTTRGSFLDGMALTHESTVRTIGCKIVLATNKETINNRLDFNDSDMASAITFSPYGNMAFVALQGNNRIAILEVGTNSRLGSLDSTGLAPQGLVFNADGTRLFVHNFMSRTVKVYNTADIILSNNFDPVVDAIVETVNKELLDAEVLLGKQIFYNAQDPRMSFSGYISCASCHLDGMSDERVWDFTDRGEGLRNTHSLRGRRGTGMGNVHWTGNFDEIQDFENDIRGAFGGKGFLSDDVFNSDKVSDPLGTSKAGLNKELDALAAYVKSLDSVHPSPYRNENGTLTTAGIAGKIVFATAGCAKCHEGADFADRKKLLFHDVGTILPSSGKRRTLPLTGFATPTLKGIWETAPYLHDGSAATLRDVLVSKNATNKHGNLSTFSQTDINNLVSYLQQLDENEATDFPSSISDALSVENMMEVYPNPAFDNIQILIKRNPLANANITIKNLEGITLFTHPVNTQNVQSIDISKFIAGIYYVNYFDGAYYSVKKIIIQ